MDKYFVYRIFNTFDFEATGLVSRTYTLELEDIGERDILVTNGTMLSIVYEDILLTINLNEKNPFEFDSHMVYVTETGDVYLGILKSAEELALLEVGNVS